MKMVETELPTHVYRLRQGEFGAIPGRPWVYWVSQDVQRIFKRLPSLANVAEPKQGLATADNMRFLRFWWEIGLGYIDFSCRSQEDADKLLNKWFPCMKGGSFRKWYGNNSYIVNWHRNGKEIQNFVGLNGRLASRPQNVEYYYREGITWSLISSKGIGFRLMPPGWIITHKGPAIYFPASHSISQALAVLNSGAVSGLLSLISPTMGFEIGHLNLLPWPNSEGTQDDSLSRLSSFCIWINRWIETFDEATFDFAAPLSWQNGLAQVESAYRRLDELEAQINEQVYALYGISAEDRAAIEAELSGGNRVEEADDEGQEADEGEAEPLTTLTPRDLAVAWLSYAVGIVLGRFHPGSPGALGSALYRRSDFALGSLPEPTEEEFDELVGDPSHFAYCDEQGGRHVFSREGEQALQALAVPDGITVFDPNHPRDLPTLVGKALELLVGPVQAQEIIQQAAGGDTTASLAATLRKFLEKEFFTRHIQQYRKRPVYWPVQSAQRSYGFVLFHERIDRSTFYALQQEPYLATKRRAVQLRLEELHQQVGAAQGARRKQIEKELEEQRQLAEELAQFARDLEAITAGGYEPEPEWIDDGVILRLAPLASVVPLWKSEPKKYWEALVAGKYDWSHIALRYWPERVREACRKNKSFAIAHGHEEWYRE